MAPVSASTGESDGDRRLVGARLDRRARGRLLAAP